MLIVQIELNSCPWQRNVILTVSPLYSFTNIQVKNVDIFSRRKQQIKTFLSIVRNAIYKIYYYYYCYSLQLYYCYSVQCSYWVCAPKSDVVKCIYNDCRNNETITNNNHNYIILRILAKMVFFSSWWKSIGMTDDLHFN